jgi:nicotinamide N-methyltransferase
MSDLLYFDKSHHALLQSLSLLLARTEEARVYVAAGKYTPDHVCQSFLKNGEMIGIIWEERVVEGEWKGTTDRGTYSRQQLADRKNNTSLWIGRWNTST